jgi:hypothetical protein
MAEKTELYIYIEVQSDVKLFKWQLQFKGQNQFNKISVFCLGSTHKTSIYTIFSSTLVRFNEIFHRNILGRKCVTKQIFKLFYSLCTCMHTNNKKKQVSFLTGMKKQ